MKIVFFAVGTRGDIQPTCVLGKELKNRGHHVRIITEERTRGIVEQFGLEYWKVTGDSLGLLYDEKKDGNNKLELQSLFIAKKKYDMDHPETPNCFYEGSIGYDVIVGSSLAIPEGIAVAEKIGAKFINLILFPVMETGEFPLIIMTFVNLYFSWLNRATYKLLDMFMKKNDSERLLKWKTEYLKTGPMDSNYLAKTRNLPNHVILAFDEILYPNKRVPFDYQENWHTTGFLYHQADTTNEVIPENILNFVGSDESNYPIVFGIGSMYDDYPKQTLSTLIKVCVKMLGKRIFIIRGVVKYSLGILDKDFLDEIDKSQILFVDYINHEWLYPRACCIINHGGVGSTASILKSGNPCLITWLHVDQPYWGLRLQQLGVGKSLKFSTLSIDNLYQSLNEILNNPSYKENSKKLSKTIKYDGTHQAANLVEKIYIL